MEQGDVDWANHANNFHWMIGSMWDLEEAVKRIVGFVDESRSMNWTNTLLIVTADHANSYMRNLVALGKGRLPAMEGVDQARVYPGGEVSYGSVGHTNELVTISAKGAAANLFKRYEAEGRPGTRILDNTRINKVMIEAIGLE